MKCIRAFFLFMIQAKAEKHRQNMEHWVKQKPVVQLMKSIGGWLPEKVLADGGYVLLTKKIVQLLPKVFLWLIHWTLSVIYLAASCLKFRFKVYQNLCTVPPLKLAGMLNI